MKCNSIFIDWVISDLRKRQIQYYDNYIYLYVTEMHLFYSIAKPVSMRCVYAEFLAIHLYLNYLCITTNNIGIIIAFICMLQRFIYVKSVRLCLYNKYKPMVLSPWSKNILVKLNNHITLHKSRAQNLCDLFD